MARRKKPQIKGTDPSYDHSFERFRPVPNDMPADVVVPGVAAERAVVETPKPQPMPASVTTEKTTTSAPEPKKAARVKPNTSGRQTPSKAKTPAVQKQITEADVSRGSDDPLGTGERQTTLDAAVKVTQAKQMAVLEEKGLKMKDIVTLAGRRATERFVLSPDFIPKPEAERLPMKQGYHTSKRLPGPILDAMRKERDPLGISSDPAMVRGQFELLFWSCLDEVIKELKAKY
ncbi:hypothetical protein [Planktotalea sp.]|uniref:hypothetical protein n=1 Tax=Planktotalea sp. TaxID=2029877 RepID=UPI003F6B8C13